VNSKRQYLYFISLCLAPLFFTSCASDSSTAQAKSPDDDIYAAKKEGLTGPEAGDPNATQVKHTEQDMRDPDEVYLDVVKYRKNF